MLNTKLANLLLMTAIFVGRQEKTPIIATTVTTTKFNNYITSTCQMAITVDLPSIPTIYSIYANNFRYHQCQSTSSFHRFFFACNLLHQSLNQSLHLSRLMIHSNLRDYRRILCLRLDHRFHWIVRVSGSGL